MDPRQAIETRLAAVMQSDRHSLRRALQRFHKQTDFDPESPQWIALVEKVERSALRVQRRIDSLPNISIPSELPIHDRADEIQSLLQQHRVLVVCGETGSGKSTQLPKICLNAGRGRTGMIAHTQPRRLAARTIASRLADETGTTLGQQVGFKIRFTDQTAPETLIKLMTDGILLAETQGDRFLDQYDTIIVDEAHERSLNIDFLLGFLHRLLQRRRDLKLIITSATLDAEKFANHFSREGDKTPVVNVEGRTYPVEVRYRPLIAGDDIEEADIGERDMLTGIVDAQDELFQEKSRGDTLIFLPTEADIRAATKRLRGRFQHRIEQGQLEVLPLYARLSVSDQNRVFRPGNRQRIVLATNVAESSLTVPGIHYVIDTGLARISRYAPRTKVQRLPIEAISQASAQQRSGRCGRIGPGICIRLYDQQEFAGRDRYTTPEIRRTNLASVILQTETLKLGKVTEFPFIDPPRPEAIRDGYKTLFELGAVDEQRRLTDLGKQLSRLPVDPRVGRMILAAQDWACLADMLILSAGLEIQDPRERPVEKRQAADEQHQKFRDNQSDFLSLLKLWDFYHDLKQKLSQSQLRKACHQNFLSYNRMREWSDLHRQLHAIVRQVGMQPGRRTENHQAIHRALLTGLLSGIAQRTDKFEYTGAGGLKFHLWPGSGLADAPPEWILVNEVVETSRRFGRTAAKIQLDWIEPAAEHLVKRHLSDPHWHEKTSRPAAFERVSLFGLPIVPRRRVPLGPRDPQEARRVFIHEGLVQQAFTGNVPLLEHNLLLVEQLREEAAKLRDVQRLIQPEQLAEWYELRLPDNVFDAQSLQHALRQNTELETRLKLERDDLLPTEDTDEQTVRFPNQLEFGDVRLRLDYRFEPGAPDDGVTATLPLESLNQISSRQLGWLVPGLLEQRIVALIRSLPKQLRRMVVPAPDTASQCVRELQFGEGNFEEAVAACLSRIAGEPIQAADFRTNKLADHLNMNLRVVDEQGEVVAEGRDLDALRTECGIQSAGYTAIHDDQWSREHMTHWDLDELPDKVTLRRNQIDVVAYLAIVDHQDDVAIELVDLEATAKTISILGIARLICLELKKPLRSQIQWLPGKDQWQLWSRGRVPPREFDHDLTMCLARRAFAEGKKRPRSRSDWEELTSNSQEKIGIATQDMMRVLPKLFERYHLMCLAREDAGLEGKGPAAIDIESQITQLFPHGFLYKTPWRWLQHYPRYLEALTSRLSKLRENRSKDLEWTELVDGYWSRYLECQQRHLADGIIDLQLEEFRWMIEEFRVSLWAQPLGTAVKVSPQRLEKQWNRVQQG